MRYRLKKILFTIFITLFLLEFFSFLGSCLSLFIFNNPPYIYVKDEYGNLENYWTEKEKWGAWHNKNILVKHKKNCFDVIYETNEIGARDKSFKEIKNKKNVILLGDSFTEGYGLNKSEMFEKYIEMSTSYNILNFGTSKDFGILQYYLIYENLAKFYDHQTVIIMLFPNNDFKDNDLTYYTNNNLDNFNSAKRFRPYYIKKNDTFEIFYPNKYKKTASNFELFLKKYFWFSNILRTIKYIHVSNKIQNQNRKTLEKEKGVFNKENFTAYYDTLLYQQEAGIFYLKKLLDNNDKKIFVFSIPLYEDYIEIKKNDIREKIFWWKNLKQLEKDYKNFKFFDLYDHIGEINYKSFFFPNECDGHWNPKGNKWAGEVISNLIKKKSE